MISTRAELIIKGWSLFYHPLFQQQFEGLLDEVEKLYEKDPVNYKQKNASKRLAAISKLIFDKIPEDPSSSEYRQGTTLGHQYKHWFRAKFFQQYRLFFRYHFDSKIIVYAWVNDDTTKRGYESKSDAYLVFKQMLKNGCPPDSWDTLKKDANNASKIVDLLGGMPEDFFPDGRQDTLPQERDY